MDSVAINLEDDEYGQRSHCLPLQLTVSDIGIECEETDITVTESVRTNGALLNANGDNCRSYIEFPRESVIKDEELNITLNFLQPRAFDDGYSFSECVSLSSTTNSSPPLQKPFTIYLRHWFSIATMPLNPIILVFTEKTGPRWNILCPDVLSPKSKTTNSHSNFHCRLIEDFVVISTTHLGSYTAMCRKCPSSLTLSGQVGPISRSCSILRFQLSKDIPPKKSPPAIKSHEAAASISFEVDNAVRFPIAIYAEELSGEWQAQDTDPYLFSPTSSPSLNAQVLFKRTHENENAASFQPRIIVKSKALLYRKKEVLDILVQV